ncbi:MAG: helix-turn-helix domain-containing protein [Flavobacteriales bacterium]
MLGSIITSLLFFSFIMLSFIMIANPIGVNKKGNIWLGFFLLFWGSHWLEEIVILCGGDFEVFQSFYILPFIQFLNPLMFYLSVRFFTHPNYKVKKILPLICIMPLFFLLVLMFKTELETYYHALFLSLVLCHAFLYISLSYFLLRQHKKNVSNFSSSPQDYDLQWLEFIIYALIVVLLIVAAFNILNYKAPLNIYMNVIFVLTVYFVAFHSLKQKEIYPINEKQTDEVIAIEENKEEDSRKKIVSDEKLVQLKSELNVIMNEKQPYLNSELNLVILSDIMETSPHILSYVINTGFNVNFPQFVNRFRVEKAKELLQNNTLANKLTIMGIAFESGFNSKTVFNTAFKKQTGKTPSQFKKECSNF